MTGSDIYLLCFLVGFSLGVLSFLAGAVHLHLPFKWHLPFHGWHQGGHFHAGHAGQASANSAQGGGSHLSWFNASTMMVFLAWFGGIGFILTTHSHLMGVVTMGFAILSGGSAAWVVFRFMVKLMNEEGSHLKDEDYRHEGLVCTVTSAIRENGTGEVVFLQGGVRRSSGARAHDGQALEKGAEVVIAKYENGIAYVHRWDEFTSLPS